MTCHALELILTLNRSLSQPQHKESWVCWWCSRTRTDRSSPPAQLGIWLQIGHHFPESNNDSWVLGQKKGVSNLGEVPLHKDLPAVGLRKSSGLSVCHCSALGYNISEGWPIFIVHTLNSDLTTVGSTCKYNTTNWKLSLKFIEF